MAFSLFIVGCFGQVLRALASKNTHCGHEPLVHFQVTPSLISAVHSLGSVSASPVVLSLFSSQDHEQIRAASCDASQAPSNPAPQASSLSSTLPSCSSYATRHRSGPSRSLRCFKLHRDVLPTICCNDTSLTWLGVIPFHRVLLMTVIYLRDACSAVRFYLTDVKFLGGGRWWCETVNDTKKFWRKCTSVMLIWAERENYAESCVVAGVCKLRRTSYKVTRKCNPESCGLNFVQLQNKNDI